MMNDSFDNEVIESVYEYNSDNDVINIDEDNYFIGFLIKTNKQVMKFLISGENLCCETYGVSFTINGTTYEVGNTSNKMQSDMIAMGKALVGKQLSKIKWIHDGNVSFKLKFVDCDTSLVISIWNKHNGYYSHTYEIKWNEFHDKDEI